MIEKKKTKLGFYTITKILTEGKPMYRIDNGKTIYIARFKKYIYNSNHEIKDFGSLKKAKDYIKLKLKDYKGSKEKKLAKIPKSLYLVLIKEESTGKTFVKVGITSKRFLVRRFSKIYGYEGYVVETILRRIDTPDAETLESKIKDTLYKKKSVKKYRPVMKSFSGYSECFDYQCLDEIITIFDSLTKDIT